MQPHAIHHLHRRKRLHSGLASYPVDEQWVSFLDNFLLVVAVISPLTSIPQLVKILVEHSAASVSIFTWSLLAILAIPWLIYGIVHKEKPIIISYALWLILDSAIVFAALAYS